MTFEQPLRPRRRIATIALALSAALISCVCSRGKGGGDVADDAAVLQVAKAFTLDESVATADLAELTKAPHPLGSERQAALVPWLETRIGQGGAKSVREPFTATVPNPAALTATGPIAETLEKPGINVWALESIKSDAPCVVALASHYDTKVLDGTDYVGANDSGSSSALLLQLVAYLKANAGKLDTQCDIVAVWFDGEEALLENWSDGERLHPAQIKDNTYGSRHSVSRLTACEFGGKSAHCLPADLGGRPLAALVLLDMVGSKNLKLTREAHSTDSLLTLATSGAKALGYPDVFGAGQAIEDDHIPFLQKGVPALDLIDFHNIDTWHQAGDSVETLSLESMETAGRIALYTVLMVAREPAKP